MAFIFEIDPIKYERDMLLMLILDGDEYGDGALERAQAKLEAMRSALCACHAFIKWERSSLEHGKPRDAQLLVDALALCHRAAAEQDAILGRPDEWMDDAENEPETCPCDGAGCPGCDDERYYAAEELLREERIDRQRWYQAGRESMSDKFAERDDAPLVKPEDDDDE